MLNQNEYYYDKDFLKSLQENNYKRELYGKIIALDFNENTLSQIEGKVQSGSINIDGKSSVRRTCNLTLCPKDLSLDINNFYCGLNTKFVLEIGLKNDFESKYPAIVWFSQGIFICTNFNTSHSTNNYSITITGKDKMAMLNGELGGNFNSSIDFNKITENKKNYQIREDMDIMKYEYGKFYVYRDGKTPYYVKCVSDSSQIPLYSPNNEYAVSIFENGKNIIKKFSISEEAKFLTLIETYGVQNVYIINKEPTYSYGISNGPYDSEIAYYEEEIVTTYKELSLREIIYYMLIQIVGEREENINIQDLEEYRPEQIQYNDEERDIYMLKEVSTNEILLMTLEPEEYKVSFNGDKVYLNDEALIYDQLSDNVIKSESSVVFYKDKEYTVIRIQSGDQAGYKLTKFTYPQDLIVRAGETVTSVLDKIKNFLGDYEYFYDINGKFVFQRQKSYNLQPWLPLQQDGSDETDNIYINNVGLSSYSYEFNSMNLINSFANTPNLTNLKNDFSVWGTKRSSTGKEDSVLYRCAIDNKPITYTSIAFDEYEQVYDENFQLIPFQNSKTYTTQLEIISEDKKETYVSYIPYKKYESKYSVYYYLNQKGEYVKVQGITSEEAFKAALELRNTEFLYARVEQTIENAVITSCDWRELIYQMAKDYNNYYERLGYMKDFYVLSEIEELSEVEKSKNQENTPKENFYYIMDKGIFSNLTSYEGIKNAIDSNTPIFKKIKNKKTFEHRVVEANTNKSTKECLYPQGKTGYEAYYTDILGFWRTVYNPDLDITEIPYGGLFLNDYDPEGNYYKKKSDGKFKLVLPRPVETYELSEDQINNWDWGVQIDDEIIHTPLIKNNKKTENKYFDSIKEIEHISYYDDKNKSTTNELYYNEETFNKQVWGEGTFEPIKNYIKGNFEYYILDDNKYQLRMLYSIDEFQKLANLYNIYIKKINLIEKTWKDFKEEKEKKWTGNVDYILTDYKEDIPLYIENPKEDQLFLKLVSSSEELKDNKYVYFTIENEKIYAHYPETVYTKINPWGLEDIQKDSQQSTDTNDFIFGNYYAIVEKRADQIVIINQVVKATSSLEKTIKNKFDSAIKEGNVYQINFNIDNVTRYFSKGVYCYKEGNKVLSTFTYEDAEKSAVNLKKWLGESEEKIPRDKIFKIEQTDLSKAKLLVDKELEDGEKIYKVIILNSNSTNGMVRYDGPYFTNEISAEGIDGAWKPISQFIKIKEDYEEKNLITNKNQLKKGQAYGIYDWEFDVSDLEKWVEISEVREYEDNFVQEIDDLINTAKYGVFGDFEEGGLGYPVVNVWDYNPGKENANVIWNFEDLPDQSGWAKGGTYYAFLTNGKESDPKERFYYNIYGGAEYYPEMEYNYWDLISLDPDYDYEEWYNATERFKKVFSYQIKKFEDDAVSAVPLKLNEENLKDGTIYYPYFENEPDKSLSEEYKEEGLQHEDFVDFAKLCVRYPLCYRKVDFSKGKIKEKFTWNLSLEKSEREKINTYIKSEEFAIAKVKKIIRYKDSDLKKNSFYAIKKDGKFIDFYFYDGKNKKDFDKWLKQHEDVTEFYRYDGNSQELVTNFYYQSEEELSEENKKLLDELLEDDSKSSEENKIKCNYKVPKEYKYEQIWPTATVVKIDPSSDIPGLILNAKGNTGMLKLMEQLDKYQKKEEGLVHYVLLNNQKGIYDQIFKEGTIFDYESFSKEYEATNTTNTIKSPIVLFGARKTGILGLGTTLPYFYTKNIYWEDGYNKTKNFYKPGQPEGGEPWTINSYFDAYFNDTSCLILKLKLDYSKFLKPSHHYLKKQWENGEEVFNHNTNKAYRSGNLFNAEGLVEEFDKWLAEIPNGFLYEQIITSYSYITSYVNPEEYVYSWQKEDFWYWKPIEPVTFWDNNPENYVTKYEDLKKGINYGLFDGEEIKGKRFTFDEDVLADSFIEELKKLFEEKENLIAKPYAGVGFEKQQFEYGNTYGINTSKINGVIEVIDSNCWYHIQESEKTFFEEWLPKVDLNKLCVLVYKSIPKDFNSSGDYSQFFQRRIYKVELEFLDGFWKQGRRYAVRKNEVNIEEAVPSSRDAAIRWVKARDYTKIYYWHGTYQGKITCPKKFYEGKPNYGTTDCFPFLTFLSENVKGFKFKHGYKYYKTKKKRFKKCPEKFFIDLNIVLYEIDMENKKIIKQIKVTEKELNSEEFKTWVEDSYANDRLFSEDSDGGLTLSDLDGSFKIIFNANNCMLLPPSEQYYFIFPMNYKKININDLIQDKKYINSSGEIKNETQGEENHDKGLFAYDEEKEVFYPLDITTLDDAKKYCLKNDLYSLKYMLLSPYRAKTLFDSSLSNTLYVKKSDSCYVKSEEYKNSNIYYQIKNNKVEFFPVSAWGQGTEEAAKAYFKERQKNSDPINHLYELYKFNSDDPEYVKLDSIKNYQIFLYDMTYYEKEE